MSWTVLHLSQSATSTFFEVCSSMTMHEKDSTWPEKPVQSVCHFNFLWGVSLHDNAWKGQTWPEKPVQCVCHFNCLLQIKKVSVLSGIWARFKLEPGLNLSRLRFKKREYCPIIYVCDYRIPSTQVRCQLFHISVLMNDKISPWFISFSAAASKRAGTY